MDGKNRLQIDLRISKLRPFLSSANPFYISSISHKFHPMPEIRFEVQVAQRTVAHHLQVHLVVHQFRDTADAISNHHYVFQEKAPSNGA